jgi:hypothetical protein
VELLPRHHLAVGRGARFRLLQRHSSRRLVHPRAGPRQGHDRRAGLGLCAVGAVGRSVGDDAGVAPVSPPTSAAAGHARSSAFR